MPRPRFSNQILTPIPIVIDPSGTYDLLVDLVDSFYPQIMIRQTYDATDSPTGCSITIIPGFVVDTSGTIEYVDNGDTVTMVDPTASQGSTQITRTGFNVNAEQYPRHLKLHIVNNDATNSVTIFAAGDW